MPQNDCILLKVLTPEKTIFENTVSKVTLPGTRSAFMVLRNHAPIITSLQAGEVKYVSQGNQGCISISSGFVEVKENVVTVCVEL